MKDNYIHVLVGRKEVEVKRGRHECNQRISQGTKFCFYLDLSLDISYFPIYAHFISCFKGTLPPIPPAGGHGGHSYKKIYSKNLHWKPWKH